MKKLDLEGRLNELLRDPDFLELIERKNRFNLFEMIAASHKELWHSAFIRWLLDPHSGHRLGLFPVKRFLYMLKSIEAETGESNLSGIDLGLIEDEEELDLANLVFETEKYFGAEYGQIDIFGTSSKLRLSIENKVGAKEGKDQTARYAAYLDLTSRKFDYDIRVFLRPDERLKPEHSSFTSITYQNLCDHVLKPVAAHPAISAENRFLVEQYIANLGKRIKGGGTIMALPNKELCLKIYRKYQDVFDEIFLSARGETPNLSVERRVRTYNVSLEHLLNNRFLDLSDTLRARYKNRKYEARLVMEDGVALIEFEGERYPSPSRVAKEIAGKNMNGWTFWEVFDTVGRPKGTLDEVRRRYLEDSAEQDLT
jgi:hypothetical protein